MYLVIALLRMAKIFLHPQASSFVNDMTGYIIIFFDWLDIGTTKVYWLLHDSLYDIFMSLLPLTLIYWILRIGSVCWLVLLDLTYTFSYIGFLWTHGNSARTPWNVLSHPQPSSAPPWLRHSPDFRQRVVARREAQWRLDQWHSNSIQKMTLTVNATWQKCDNFLSPSCDEFGNRYPSLVYLVGSAYHFLLLGIGILYFLGRLFRYKIGQLRCPHEFQPVYLHRYPNRTRRHGASKRGGRNRRRLLGTHTVSSLSTCFHSMAFTSVLNVDDRLNQLKSYKAITFDSDSATVICDNSANVSICKDRSFFVGEIRRVSNHKVATIGGKGHSASGIGTVKWSWLDDDGNSHDYHIKDVLYFPESPINILSVTAFARQLQDNEYTGIDTKLNFSRFYWDHGKGQRTIRHPASNLPEMEVNSGYSLFTRFRAMVCKLIDTGVDSRFSAHFIDFGETTSSCHCAHAHASDLTNHETFDVGETLFYTKDGFSTLVKVHKLKFDQDNILRITVTTPNGNHLETTKEHLRAPEQPDIGWIPSSVPDFQTASGHLTEEQIATITSPRHLSPLQQEFLSLHNRLFHLPFTIMLRMAKLGLLPQRFLKLRNDLPPCIDCLFGQSHRKPWRTKGSSSTTSGILQHKSISTPGQTVGTDQIVSAQPGLVPQWKGKLTRSRIWGATIFVDYATKWVKVHLMTEATGAETLAAKKSFEHASSIRGVHIRHYHADNGRFAESEFTNDCKEKIQKLTFCGVGAHHQNGVAENMIKQLTLTARTILLHAQRMWPEYITSMMWPLALLSAADRLNNLHIDLNGETPEMKFSQVSGNSTRLANFHPFGCPCYILDARLQSAGGGGPPKWDPRARLGIYVGHSPMHAGNVALVLNPRTGLISPQFHVIFDDDFSTVSHLRAGTVPTNWAQLVEHSREKCIDGFYDVTKTWFEGISDPSAEESSEHSQAQSSKTQTGTIQPSVGVEGSPRPDVTPATLIPNASEGGLEIDTEHCSDSEVLHRIEDSSTPSLPFSPAAGLQLDDTPDYDTKVFADESCMPSIVDFTTAGLRRSTRDRKSPDRFVSYSSIFSRVCAIGLAFTALWSPQPSVLYSAAQNMVFATVNMYHAANECFDGTLNCLHPMAFLVSSDNNDTYTFKEMLRQPDAKEFIAAMMKETSDHETHGHWEVVPRWKKPPDVKTIMAIWSFKRKRFPDGRLLKYKARLCAHGGMQTWGVNYWETYAPTVNWISVRFLLIVAEILRLDTKAIDFILAFPQADLDVPVYMELPAGMELAGHGPRSGSYVLKLRKSLYGLKQASFNWHNKLKSALEERGFVESLSDPCVFIGKNMVVLCYVDDCILIGKDANAIPEFMNSLEQGPENFKFTDEGSMSSYLGVDISRHDDEDGFTLSQPFLIDRIIKALNFDPAVTKGSRGNTPVAYPLLSKDEDGLGRKAAWSYRSVIGMLGYLQGTTRPDISMAVHQCARFNSNPKLSHERAVKRIVRYLLDSRDKGLVFRPDLSRGLECFVDADFAGGWKDGDHSFPEAVLSRTGFVIMFAGCPITWSSKLQTEIALSTTESEYIALSTAMREVIPFLNLMKEISDIFDFPTKKPVFSCKVWEDNESCIKVAKSPKFTPRTKHIAIKYHHFRRFVDDNTIDIQSIDTSEQLADILTKPLPEKAFCYLRKRLMGW